jgi:hypothetical protein
LPRPGGYFKINVMSKEEQIILNAITSVKWCPLEISLRTKLPVTEVEEGLKALSAQGKIKKHKDAQFSLINPYCLLNTVI